MKIRVQCPINNKSESNFLLKNQEGLLTSSKQLNPIIIGEFVHALVWISVKPGEHALPSSQRVSAVENGVENEEEKNEGNTRAQKVMEPPYNF